MQTRKEKIQIYFFCFFLSRGPQLLRRPGGGGRERPFGLRGRGGREEGGRVRKEHLPLRQRFLLTAQATNPVHHLAHPEHLETARCPRLRQVNLPPVRCQDVLHERLEL